MFFVACCVAMSHLRVLYCSGLCRQFMTLVCCSCDALYHVAVFRCKLLLEAIYIYTDVWCTMLVQAGVTRYCTICCRILSELDAVNIRVRCSECLCSTP